LPEVLKITAEFVLTGDLKHTFDVDPVDSVRIAMLLELVKVEGVTLQDEGLSFSAGKALSRLMRRLESEPLNAEVLERADVLVTLLQMFPFQINYWKAQNIYYSMLRSVFPFVAKGTDEASRNWTRRFLGLGEKLRVRAPKLEAEVQLKAAS
jgi:hypothetical protein